MKKFYYKSREEWEAVREGLIREGRLGGSMVGTAVGADPWKSPYTLWAEMSGLVAREDVSGRESVRVGTDLEDYVARRFCDLSGKKVHRENCVIVNEAFPHLFATIDRKVSGEESGLECKTANAYREGAFAQGRFPDGYYRQVKTYLAVTGLERWFLAVLIMGIDFRVFLVTRRAEDMEALPPWVAGARLVSEMELEDCDADAAEFVEGHVRAGVPPAMSGAEGERATVDAIHGRASAGEVALDAEADALCARRAELKARGDATREELAAVENEIVARLGGAESGRSEAWRVSYRWSESRRLDRDAVAAAMGGAIPEGCFKVSRGAALRVSPAKKSFR